jgi:hypothetical protein
MWKKASGRRWGTGSTLIASFLLFSSVAAADDNAITADPLVPRPKTKPCVVQLFEDLLFNDYEPRDFEYAPPLDCPPPWAKVVFEADYSVTPGRQFDRTAQVWIGATNIYFGTTQEPSATIGPSWHVERDLTDYSPLFANEQPGRAILFNVVNETYTSVLYGTADLQFYPLEPSEDPPVTADAVFPLSAGDRGGPVSLETFDTVLERSFALPTNIERAYLDVVAQNQSTDEFWMLCVPNEVSGPLRSCGGTGFRETEIAIDGQPAGVAPIYPWIFTGGIDPYLWRPIPGVQTFNFVPYRVDLTPFAGVLSNGEEHSIAVRVYNANHRFDTTASLLVYLDPGARQVTGEVTENNLDATPTPDVQFDVRTIDGVTSGEVNVYSSRAFAIAGVANTSHGTVQTRVEQRIDFSSEQQFYNITPNSFGQDLNQMTRISSRTTVSADEGEQVTLQRFGWPLTLSFSITPRSGGISARRTVIQQEYHAAKMAGDFSSQISSVVTPGETLLLMGSTVVGHEDWSGSHEYFSRDSTGACYDRRITALDGRVSGIFDGERCDGR